MQGSLCVGFDCVNNENFGFDTIRLKENNLRIKFEDTSVGAFPTNDWQILANDSASGGSAKFSIEDVTGARTPFTIEAGATTNSIFVDSTGRVGFRTSTPVLDLHVNTSNTPALRLEQNNSGGFTAQTWDIGGNEANFFVRDVTGGSLLPFRIRPGAPTSSIDISADGDVGIGTASPGINSGAASRILTVFSSSSRGMLELVNGQADAAGNTAGQVRILRQLGTPSSQTSRSPRCCRIPWAPRQITVAATCASSPSRTTRRSQSSSRSARPATVRFFSLTNCGSGIVSRRAAAHCRLHRSRRASSRTSPATCRRTSRSPT